MFRKQIQIIPLVPFRLAILFVVLARLLCTPVLLAQNYQWKVISRPSSVSPLISVDFIDTLHGVCGVLGSPGAYVTTDGGIFWDTSRTFFSPWAIDLVDSTHGWAAGTQGVFGEISRTTDCGRSWTLLREKFGEEFRGVAGLSPTKCVCAGFATDNAYVYDTAMIVRTTDGGNTWERVLLDAGVRAKSVQFVDSLYGFVRTTDLFAYRTIDGGANWEKVATPDWFGALYFANRLQGWGGAGGWFYGTSDGGQNWRFLSQVPDSGDSFYVEALAFTDTLFGWAFGDGFWLGSITEVIYRTTDGGASWWRESIGLTSDLGGLLDGVMLDRAHGYAVAADGRVLAYKPKSSDVEPLATGEALPSGICLVQNYPNPFNGKTTISYDIPSVTVVDLEVVDILGRTVASLVHRVQLPGSYSVEFSPETLSSGIYFVRLTTSRHTTTRRMLLLR